MKREATSIASLKGRCLGTGISERAQSPKISITQIRRKIIGSIKDKKAPKVKAFSTDKLEQEIY